MEVFEECREGEAGLKEDKCPDVIICVPWDGDKVEGSTTGICDKCGREVAVAPSTREIIARCPGVPTRCMLCVHLEVIRAKAEGGING